MIMACRCMTMLVVDLACVTLLFRLVLRLSSLASHRSFAVWQRASQIEH